MQRQFAVTLHVPLGERHGTLRFTQRDGTVSGTLEAFGAQSPFSGTASADGHLQLDGRMHAPRRSFPFCAEGYANGNTLELTVAGDRYAFRITGEETPPPDKEVTPA